MLKESYFLVDSFSQKDNFFTRVDARIKLVYSLLAIFLMLILPGVKFSLLVFAAALLIMLFMKIPLKVMFRKLLPPIVLSSIIVIIDTFLLGNKGLFSIPLFGWVFNGHLEGFNIGLRLAARVLGSVSIIISLAFSTPVNELMLAAGWFRVPKVMIEIFMLTYRYLFVFWDEGSRIRQAQVMRLGYPNWKKVSQWKKAMKSTSTLLGMVLIRAYDRAENTYQAMVVRGYKGKIIGDINEKWGPVQWKYSTIGMTILIIFVAISYR